MATQPSGKTTQALKDPGLETQNAKKRLREDFPSSDGPEYPRDAQTREWRTHPPGRVGNMVAQIKVGLGNEARCGLPGRSV